MKAIIFNEEEDICRVEINNYKYNRIKQVDSYNGTFDVQETISFLPNNYDDVKDFIIQSGREINFMIYDEDDKVGMYQPSIEMDDVKEKITMIKIKTFWF